jgi:PucR family transcriptional regulator, purine catabolism regulatory protein
MLTVRELVEGVEVRLLTGEEGLDLPVRWVHISELPDPTPWLSGGELLLTTGLQLDTAQRQREFVTRLADHQLAGIGFGTGFTHDAVPAPLLEAAASRGFPVFEVPYELPFIAVTESAFAKLVNDQYAVLRRALAAQERLERLVLSERGLDALAGAIATLLGAAVLLLDGRGDVLARHEFRRDLDDDALESVREEVRSRRGDARAFVPSVEEGHQGLALPVTADGSPAGGSSGAARAPEAWIVAIKDGGALSDFDRLTLRQAVTIVALELLRARVAGQTERRLAGDVLQALVSGELAGSDLARRLAPFGVGDRVAAIVLPESELEERLAAALRDEAVPALVAPAGSMACALVPGMEDDELVALVRRAVARMNGEAGSAVRAGVGRAVPAGEGRRSFHEARCALEAVTLGVSANGSESAGIATYKDLGSFQLLLSLQDDEALRLFCDSVLGPIEASEGGYGGELMRSLEAFIEENGQWERAARRLYCHRHTLRYRIRRVEELTGRDLHNARDRIDFWLALRGRELVAP